jgi:hypothetical protein
MSCLLSTESVIVMLTRQAVYIKPNTEAHNHCCSRKATGISSLALVTQHAKPWVLSYCYLWSVQLYRIFPYYFINGTIFGKVFNKNVFRFSVFFFSETFLILRRNKRDIIINVYLGVHMKYPLFMSDFNKICLFWADFWNMLKYKLSWKSVQGDPSCYMRTDRQTDMKKLILDFEIFRTRL